MTKIIGGRQRPHAAERSREVLAAHRQGIGVALSLVGFWERAHRVRRGERGVEWMGGPLWSPA